MKRKLPILIFLLLCFATITKAQNYYHSAVSVWRSISAYTENQRFNQSLNNFIKSERLKKRLNL